MFHDPIVLNLRDRSSWPKSGKTMIVDRSSKWGNPIKVDRRYTRAEAIRRYEIYLVHSDLMLDLEELLGYDLACWCSPLPCHADVLIKYVNAFAADLMSDRC